MTKATYGVAITSQKKQAVLSIFDFARGARLSATSAKFGEVPEFMTAHSNRQLQMCIFA
jgi:hypothetical protein